MIGSIVSPVLVGRASESAAVRAAYERALARRPVTVLVSGEAGIGKSRLVATVAGTLPGEPLVLSGGCLELGAEGAPYVPFVAILRDLVRRLGRDRVAALLPPSGSALGDWLPDLGPSPATYGRVRLLEEMLGLITRVSEARPVVLVVEDLHWADASSRELFAYLARNLNDGAVLLIGTIRTGELAAGHPNRKLLAELGRGGDVVRLALGPLEHRHVVELLAAIDGRRPDRSRSERIHRRSGGNPLFVETLSDADEASAGDLRSLLIDRITDLPDPAREVLSALAVAGAELPDRILLEVGGLDEPRQRRAVADLVGRDLVVVHEDAYAIRHELIREAMYASLLPAERRRRHARYAAVLAARDADDLALAEHWIAAGEPERALPAAWRAADRAARQNAYDEQLYLLELILRSWAEVADPPRLIGADRTTVLERAAAAAHAAGRSAAGVGHATAALAGLAPESEPQRVARLLGLRGQSQNRVDGTGIDDLERAIALVPAGSSDALRGGLLSALAFVGIGAHRHGDSRRHAAEALDIAERLDDDGLRAPALLVLAALDGMDGETEPAERMFAEARRAAEAALDVQTFLTTFQWEAALLESTGRYGPAAELAGAGRREAVRLGRARSRGSALASARAVPLRLLGRWDEALRLVEDTLAEGPPPLYGAFVRLVAADIARCRGETDRFEILLRQLTEFALHARGAAEVKVEIALQRIAWALDQGDPALADRVLGEQLPPASPQPDVVMRLAALGARAQRARRAAAPRNRGVAGQCADRLAQLAGVADSVRAVTPAVTAYRRTFEAEVADTLAAWDRAAEAWRGLLNPYETATALTDAAAAALTSNNRPGARSRLREARAIAAELGAAPLLTRIGDLTARGRLGEDTDAPAPNGFGLTRRELDVLRVLARGRSNPQIAEELFITPNTVASHVARILTKLGATTRTEAAARAHEADLLSS
ncbi:helix-turn-helix transcriptional regulator [Actinoallomurus iriomotensis]|uniref:LuxR family transcriptional regulator n=1 Tax=Actinoallomurus iriomotensis TaxID=478107 RepID=A0A9W6VSA4_9ACTN|nr:LuxR family transcriptional regulator [Actinoallomurus iriomotensis]GLY77874.1 LuxR family transcriptional regulator [Actinoallomurus iriomotensis]